MSEPGDQVPANAEPAPDPSSISSNVFSDIETASDTDGTSFERIIPRLLKSIAILGVLFLGPIFFSYGWLGAIGFTSGVALSYINFRSLSQGVEGLAARVVDQHSSEKGGRIIMRFVLRYLLVGVVAYAIFRGSTQAFRGFLWGLCVPAGSLMVEAIWQGFKGFCNEPKSN